MYSLVSQREQARDGQRKALQAPLTDQCIIHAVLLHVGDGVEHEHGLVVWFDNPYPPDADSEILGQFLSYVLPAIVGRHDFDHQVWSAFEKSVSRTIWPASAGQKRYIRS